MRDQLIEIGKSAAAVAAIAGLAVLLAKAVRGMLRTMRKIGRLVDEVLGDGDKRPGWGQRLTGIEALGKTSAGRLTGIESRVTGLEKKVGTVIDEVKPNGGASMRDQINRIEQATGASPDAE